MNLQKLYAWGQPTIEQKLLLQAALLPGEIAINSWQQWKTLVDLENLDSESYRLLPLLYRNLSQAGITDVQSAKLKGVYRRTWCENQVIFKKLAEILPIFADKKIQTLLLKDAALSRQYYSDQGVRMIHNFELLVYPQDGIKAMNLLLKQGWKPKKQIPNQLPPFSSCLEFQSDSNFSLMLRWHLFWDRFSRNIENGFWQRAKLTKFGNSSTNLLNPTDQLFYTCVSGGVNTAIIPLVRLADAKILIESEFDNIDWNQLLTQVEQFRFVLPFHNFLKALQETLNLSLLDDFVTKTLDLPVSQFELREFILVNQKHRSLLERVLKKIIDYQRMF